MESLELDKELSELFNLEGKESLDEVKLSLGKATPEELTRLLCFSVLLQKPQIFDLLVQIGADVNGKMPPGNLSPMHCAALNGYIEFAKKLIAQKALIDARCNENRTPLNLASNSGQLTMVKWLVENGADLYALDEFGGNALHSCAITENKRADSKTVASIGAYLLKQGVSCILSTKKGRVTPLHLALMNGWEELATIFINQKGEVLDAQDEKGFTPLHYAALHNYATATELLLEQEVNIDASNHEASTPLILAANHGCEQTVKILVRAGANLEAKNAGLFTPLFSALFSQKLAVISFLIEEGADIEAKDHYGRSPLFLAAWSGNLAAVQLLVEKGANLNSPDFDLYTPLHQATLMGHKEVAFYLVEKGADCFAVTRDGDTLLHAASSLFQDNGPFPVQAEEPLEDLAFELIKRGLDIHAKTKYGSQPLHLAATHSLKLVKYYVESGVDPKAVGGYRETALHKAAFSGKTEICRFLIASGTPLDLPNEQGHTPLLLATSSNHEETALELLKHEVEVNPPRVDLGVPLTDAIWMGAHKLIAKLIEKGANVNRPTHQGKTPYQIAQHRLQPEIAAFLVENGARKGFSLFLNRDRMEDPAAGNLAVGYDVWVTNAKEAIKLLEQGGVLEISLDYDLGPDEAGTGYDVAKFIEEKAFLNEIPRLKWRVHSANPVGSAKMKEALRNADRYWDKHESSTL